MDEIALEKNDRCPYCSYEINRSETIGNKKCLPSTGDLSFCAMCCEAMIFDSNLNLQKFDLNSVKDLMERAYYKNAQNKIKEAWDNIPEIQKHKERRQKFLNNVKLENDDV
jgi:hypothetical protein